MAPPTKKTPATLAKIYEAIALGASVQAACKKADVNEATFFTWISNDPDMHKDYMRARENRSDARFEKMDDIMERVSKGEIDHATARIMIDTMKYQCGVEKAHVYGKRQEIDHKSTDGSMKPVQFNLPESICIALAKAVDNDL